MKRLVYYFFQGLLFLVPFALTIWVFVGVLVVVDRWMRALLPYELPGLGLVVMLVLVTGIGFLASNFVTRRAMLKFETVMERVPLAKLLYGAVKDLLTAFVGEEKKFRKPVVVDLSADGHVKAFGFVTRDALELYGLPENVAVYFPQAYNFAGQVVVVPRSAVTPLPLDAGEVMAFIVSGGVTGPGRQTAQERAVVD